jgi:hypothetical protein
MRMEAAVLDGPAQPFHVRRLREGTEARQVVVFTHREESHVS